VRPDLEMLPRVLVLERAADHGVDVPLRRQGNRTGDGCAGARRRLDDRRRRAVERLMVIALQADSDLRLRQFLFLSLLGFSSCN
jgi:hypothetical protein